jgi:glycosyltransferase involved in cell wall biosynthesis
VSSPSVFHSLKVRAPIIKPRILYVIPSLDIGGAEQQLAAVAGRLTQKGWNVSVYSLRGKGCLTRELQDNRVKALGPPVGRSKNAPLKLKRIFRLATTVFHLLFLLLKTKPHIVHFFLPAAYLVGGPLAIITGVPIRIMSRHSMNLYQRGRPLSRTAERILHRRMQAVIAVSSSILCELRDEESVKPDRLGVIYNGIELKNFINLRVQQTSTEIGLADNTFVMVIVANLILYKGHRDLLQAIAIAKPELPDDWRLLIVGRDEGIGDQLRDLAKQLAIEDRIMMLGQRTDVLSILSCSHVGILCSHQEGLSIAILEAMAMGLPLIVTDVGGSSEMVIDGENGLLVPPKNAQKLAEAIVRLARDAQLRQRLGQAGYRRVQERFTLETCVSQYEKLYMGLCESARRPVSEILVGPTCSSPRNTTVQRGI